MELSELRKEIDLIDEEILNLLSKRANVAIDIGDFKSKNNLEIFNKDREDKIFENLINKNNGPLSDNAVRAIFEQIIVICRDLQKL